MQNTQRLYSQNTAEQLRNHHDQTNIAQQGVDPPWNQDREVPLCAQRVAEFFLNRSLPNSIYAVTPLKLQKLVYYAQALFLAEHEEPLFNDEIQAWAHGPVVPNIYRKYRDYGYSEIDIMTESFSLPELSERQRNILNDVWLIYGGYDGKFLESQTHSESPWKSVYKPNMNQVISVESMRDYYGSM